LIGTSRPFGVFFRWLVDDGVIEKNPAEGVRFLKPSVFRGTIGFSDEEVQRIPPGA